jgi:type I pantothenate kinase
MPGPLSFSREEWAALRAATPLTLDEADLAALRGINEAVALDEVVDVYLPLSRLLNLHVSAAQALHRVADTFLGRPAPRVPYVIALVGSVAVGKSTTARILQTLLARWPDHPTVDLVTTDGFLLPNRVLNERGLGSRKGFPESYDREALVAFLAALKAGEPALTVPLYSHVEYDIVDDVQIVDAPDVVIIEGLNLLQIATGTPVHITDFVDFSIYVDAEEHDVEQWFIDRFLTLRESVFQDERSFFHHFAGMSADAATAFAREIWTSINGVNLHENILPTRARAHLVLEKGPDHAVRRVRLRAR